MPIEQDEEMQTTIGGVSVTRRGNSAVVDFAPGSSRMSRDDSDEHSANIVDDLESNEQSDLANTIIEWVDVDLESRADWQRRMDQAMELLGLRNIPEEELPFDGASAVTYPLIGEAVVQFQARAIEEVFPSEGPVKVRIVGKKTEEKTAQAERVKDHMNYQILEQDRSYFWNVDQMLFYLPLGGSAFKKTYFDSVAEMVVSRFIKSPDFIVPYIATDLASSPRYTHRMYKGESEMKKLFASGFYKEIDLPKVMPYVDSGIDDEKVYFDEADTRQPSMHPDDSVYTLYECHCDLELEEDQALYARKAPLPYIVTVERQTREIVGIRRNWKEDDPLFIKRMWFTHYRYLPGLGFYGFGLLHMIGSVAEATSATIRALLDSAAFANMQGGYVSSDAKMKPGDEHIEAGTYKEINMTAEELQRAFYTPPFKEPSPALAKLFEILVDAGKAFSSATEVMTGEASNTGPVGTTIALIEQSNKPFSGIHRRLHMAAAEEFKLRAELNYEFLSDEYPYEVEDAESVVMRDDYDGRVDVLPVSDPNIHSSVQRIAQGQATVQLAAENPDLYNRRVVHLRFLKSMRIPDAEEMLIAEQEQTRTDAVTENSKILVGEGVNAFIEQEHDAHIQVHMNFIQGLSGEALEMVEPPMRAHLAEHYAMKYWNEMNQQMGGQMPPLQLHGRDEETEELTPEQEQMITQAAAQMEPIQLMPPEEGSPDMEQAEFEAEEQRKIEEFVAEEDRKAQAFLAEQERQDVATLAKDDRDDALALLKEDREKKAADAKIVREEEANKAKIEREKKVAAAKPKPKKA
jgi:hypothetical protein